MKTFWVTLLLVTIAITIAECKKYDTKSASDVKKQEDSKKYYQKSAEKYEAESISKKSKQKVKKINSDKNESGKEETVEQADVQKQNYEQKKKSKDKYKKNEANKNFKEQTKNHQSSKVNDEQEKSDATIPAETKEESVLKKEIKDGAAKAENYERNHGKPSKNKNKPDQRTHKNIEQPAEENLESDGKRSKREIVNRKAEQGQQKSGTETVSNLEEFAAENLKATSELNLNGTEADCACAKKDETESQICTNSDSKLTTQLNTESCAKN